jgi:hypothetical protein
MIITLIITSLLISTTAVKAQHEAGGTEAILIINSMMQSNSLPPTRQLSHCFSQDEANALLGIITKLTTVAAEAGTT